jgi:NADPH-dependent 2,4-dienoyl-CoA reductase/sulfur reductase-like enzyme
VRGASRVEAVELDDGTVLQADAVLVGIGAVPVTGWLEGAELDLSSGLMCDEYLGVGPPGIVAAGDVANWFNPRYGERMRIEHWTTAVEQGGIAARNLLAPAGEGAPADLVPYFWSDQYDLRIQFAGRVGDDVRTVRAGDGQRPSVLALSGRGGLLTGVLSVEADRAFVRARRMLRGTVRLEEAEAITRELLGGGGRDRTRPAQQRPSAPSIS